MKNLRMAKFGCTNKTHHVYLMHRTTSIFFGLSIGPTFKHVLYHATIQKRLLLVNFRSSDAGAQCPQLAWEHFAHRGISVVLGFDEAEIPKAPKKSVDWGHHNYNLHKLHLSLHHWARARVDRNIFAVGTRVSFCFALHKARHETGSAPFIAVSRYDWMWKYNQGCDNQQQPDDYNSHFITDKIVGNNPLSAGSSTVQRFTQLDFNKSFFWYGSTCSDKDNNWHYERCGCLFLNPLVSHINMYLFFQRFAEWQLVC